MLILLEEAPRLYPHTLKGKPLGVQVTLARKEEAV